MLKRLFGLDATQSLIAAQSCTAIIVGYYLALLFDWKASSVATTVIVLQTAALGSTISKAAARMLGTLAGAVTGLVFVALFAHNGFLFILSMALLTGACVWGMQNSKHTYAWMLLLLTSAIVGWPAANDPLTTFQTSIDRVTAVAVGVILSGIAQSIFWPITAGEQYERSIREVIEGCRTLLSTIKLSINRQEINFATIIDTESKLFALASSLDAKLETARADSKHLKIHAARYQQLNQELFNLFTATTMVSDTCRSLANDSESDTHTSSSLQQLFNLADEQCETLLKQMTLPRNGIAGPIEMTSDPLKPEQETDATNSEQNSLQNLKTSLLRKSFSQFGTVAKQIQIYIERAESSQDSISITPSSSTPAPAFKARLRKSALATLQVLMAAYLYVMLNWPLGLQVAMMLVMILAFMNAQLPVALLTRTFLKGVLIALPLGAVFHFVVMPQVDSFAELAPCLLLLFFPPLYLAANPNPIKSMTANMSILLTNSLISISSIPPSYEFASFINTYLGISGGFGVVLFLAYLFETRSPRRGVHKLIASILSQLADWLETNIEQPPSSAEYEARKKQIVATLGKLKKVASQVDFSQCESLRKSSIDSTLNSIEMLAWQLLWSQPTKALPQDEPSSQTGIFLDIRNWCVDSITTMGSSLRSCQPMTIDITSSQLIRELISTDTSAEKSSKSFENVSHRSGELVAKFQYYRSLITTVLDCNRSLNKVDWKRWNQNYF